jgi:hypothetical protein
LTKSPDNFAEERTASIDYNDVLPPHTRLDIWEVYARLVLQFIDAAKYGHLVHGDKPDLQDVKLNLGVEVTQAIPDRNQEAEALYAGLHNEKDEASRSRTIERIEQLGGKVFNHVLFGPNGTDNFDLIIDAFKEKLRKLNAGGYKHFEHNHLFIRSNIYADSVMLDKGLASFVALNIRTISFERIIVSVPGHNYDFDLINRLYRDLSFTSTDQYLIGEKARSAVIEAEADYAAK